MLIIVKLLLYRYPQKEWSSVVPPSTVVEPTHSPGTMQSSPTNDQMEWKLRTDKQVFYFIFDITYVGVLDLYLVP